ncbi:transposon Tf2-8 polyprotein [Trichonephila inaurata madagascariensis]|uniref:Transposon Tf2-8 polyprotein n=1 Tax=Trichonephila inaurata madagascariensis TaxID=2747483 RepID=A0A8X7C3M6_9ARAC|nr:transposon Tf2-8 polyprotein [Trichonephila inaurata madagascariensis]
MPNDRASGSKDMLIRSGNEPRNKDVGHDVEEHYTEGDYLPQNKSDSEDYFAEARHETSPVTDFFPRPRSCIPSNKRNERTKYYDSNRKYGGEKKGNFYHRSNSDTRGRRYGPNSYEKCNNTNQNYQDARRQNYDSEVNNKSDCAQFSNESLNEASGSISPSDKECFQNIQPECDDKDESKRRDGPYIVLSQRFPTTFVVASCDKPDEPLDVYHTSALIPFLNGIETQSPVITLKKRGRPRKQPLIPRGTAGENAILSASTPPRRDGLRWCRGRM